MYNTVASLYHFCFSLCLFNDLHWQFLHFCQSLNDFRSFTFCNGLRCFRSSARVWAAFTRVTRSWPRWRHSVGGTDSRDSTTGSPLVQEQPWHYRRQQVRHTSISLQNQWKLVRLPAYYFHTNVWATTLYNFECPQERWKVCCVVAQTSAWK